MIEEIAVTVSKRFVEQLQDSRTRAQTRRLGALDNFDRHVMQALAEHSGLLESGATTVDALLEEPEFQRIADNYAVEAQREALLERARMLAYALAGTLCSGGLTIMQKSRVERVIRELDPADVLQLYEVSLVHIEQSEIDGFDRDAIKRLELLDQRPSSRDILRASGCIDVVSNGGLDGGVLYAHITTIGRDVLEILRGYTQAPKAEPPA